MVPSSTDLNVQLDSKSESIFFKVWESSADGMRITDSLGTMKFVNEAFCKMVEKDKSLLIGQPMNIIFKKEKQEELMISYKKSFTGKLQERSEREIELWNGEIINVELANSFIKLDSGERLVLSIFRNITERKKLEIELFESREMLQLVLDHIPQRVFWKDRNSNFLGCNQLFADDAGLKDPSEIIGLNDYQLSWKGTAELYRSDDKMVMETGAMKINYEEPQTRTDGGFLCLRTSKVPLKDENGEIIGILGTYEDITEKKLKDEQLQKALKEKDAMLHEVHYRVKNNLQIISSLLNIQSKYIEDPRDFKYFQITQNRVKSISLIHENLYNTTDFTSIDFEKYIRQFAVHLFQTYDVSYNRCKLTINIKNIFIGIDLAIPCGLIINEVLTNSLIHAFPHNVSGEISIDMFLDKENKYVLILKDNGIGMPEDIYIKEAKTMGLQLINTLCTQIGGKIEIDRKIGTQYKITFPSLQH